MCITHYQRVEKLKDAIDAVFAQTYPNIELIVVDDGSPDSQVQADLVGIEEELKTRGGKLIRRENGYLGAARNTGAAAAQGTHICFLDDDDLALPTMIENLARAALTSGAEIVSGLQAPIPVSRRNEAMPNPEAYPGKVEFFPLGGPLALTLNEYCLANASSLIRLDAFQELGGYSELRNIGGEDHEFYTRALQQGARIEISPHTAYLYETDASSMWGANSQTKHMARVASCIDFNKESAQWHEMVNLVAGTNAKQRTKAIREWALRKSTYRDTLQNLYESSDLIEQLQYLGEYSYLIENGGLAQALSSAMISLRDKTGFQHTRPAVASRRDDNELPTELGDALEALSNYVSAPEFMRGTLLNEVRSAFDRDFSALSCRRLLGEIAKLEYTDLRIPLVDEITLELALRAKDYQTARGIVSAAAKVDENSYLRQYPDIAGAVEAGKIKDGITHYVKWGATERREGFVHLESLKAVVDRIAGNAIPLTLLQQAVRQICKTKVPGKPESQSRQAGHGTARE